MNKDYNYIKPTPVHGFHFWCQKVIPLVFDDSLSYYEVLCKLTHFMNEFAETLNQTIEGLEQLQEYFDEFSTNITNIVDELSRKVDELDSFYIWEVNAHALEDNQHLSGYEDSLIEILNDMLKKQVVKPIVLAIRRQEGIDYNGCNTEILHINDTFLYMTNEEAKNNIMLATKPDMYFDNSYGIGVTNQVFMIPLTDFDIVDGQIVQTGAHITFTRYQGTFLPTSGYSSVSFTPTNSYDPTTVAWVQQYVSEHGGGGGGGDGLPTLEIDFGYYEQNGGAIQLSETTALGNIINDMITNNAITPIVIKLNHTGIYNYNSDSACLSTIMILPQYILSSIKDGYQPDITLFSLCPTVIDGSVKNYIYKLTLGSMGYYLNGDNTITVTGNATIESTTKAYLPTDGSDSLYYPTTPQAPASKKYVDDMIGTVSDAYNIEVMDIANMTSSEIDLISNYLNAVFNDNTPYTLRIKDNTENARYVFKSFPFKDFGTFIDQGTNYQGTEQIMLQQEGLISYENDANGGSLTINYDYDCNADPVFTATSVSYSGVDSNFTDLARVNDVIRDDSIQLIRYDSNYSFTFDSSNPRSLSLNESVLSNNMPDINSGWILASVVHLFFDESHLEYRTGLSENFSMKYTSSYPEGIFSGSYQLTGTSLVDGHTYHDVYFLTFKHVDLTGNF